MKRKKINIDHTQSKTPEELHKRISNSASRNTQSPRLSNFVRIYNKNERYTYSPVFSEKLKSMRLSDETSKFTNTQIKELSKQKLLQS